MRQIMRNTRTPQFHISSLGAAVALVLAAGTPSAFAFEFKSGEVTGSFDTTVTAGALWRMDERDPALVSIANGGTSRDPNSDDGNLRYDRGDIVSSLLKATHELELKYRNFGAFTRAIYFYDFAVHDKDNLFPATKNKLGDGGEILDAYIRGTFDLDGRNLNVRLGKQVVSWGESTFIMNGINVLNPINVMRLRVPGAELKEGLIPTQMIFASQEITDKLSVEVALMTEWKKTRIEPAGSFFSTNDFVADDATQAYTGFGRRYDLNNGPVSFFTGNPLAQIIAPRSADREPGNDGQYGIASRYFAPELNNTEFGFYHANYHSRTPFVSGIRGSATVYDGTLTLICPAGPCGSYFVEYPKDIKLYGLSMNTGLPGGVALQGEYSYRQNQPLQLPSAELLLAALGQANQLGTYAVGQEVSGYRRVKMHQIQFTGTKAFGPTFGAEQLVTVGEVGYTYLDLPDNLKFAAPGCHLPQVGSSTATSSGSTSSDCFATRNSWGYRLVGRLDYPNALDAVTVSPRIAFSHDVSGFGPTFNEDAKALTLGVGFNLRQVWQADIGYTAFFGGLTRSGTDPAAVPLGQPTSYASGTNPLKDRDFLAVSISYSF